MNRDEESRMNRDEEIAALKSGIEWRDDKLVASAHALKVMDAQFVEANARIKQLEIEVELSTPLFSRRELENQLANACKLHEVTQVRLSRAVDALKAGQFYVKSNAGSVYTAPVLKIIEDALNFINDSENGSEAKGENPQK